MQDQCFAQLLLLPSGSVITHRDCLRCLHRYGSGDPKIVFVERKTHRESWKGEESVKERIVLPEENVVPFLEQTYTVEQAVDDLRTKVGVESMLRAEHDRAGVDFALLQHMGEGKPVILVGACEEDGWQYPRRNAVNAWTAGRLHICSSKPTAARHVRLITVYVMGIDAKPRSI